MANSKWLGWSLVATCSWGDEIVVPGFTKAGAFFASKYRNGLLFWEHKHSPCRIKSITIRRTAR